MARPQKNNCDYFPHDNDMRNHVKIRAIRNKYEHGYAIWSMLLEFLTGSDGNTFEKTPLQMELLSGDFGVSVTEISDVVDYCIKLELLFEKDGWIYSESLNERLLPVYEKRGKSKQLSAKQKRENGKFIGNNAVTTVVSVAETPQSKVNKRKEKEIEDLVDKSTSDLPKSDFDLIVDSWMEYKKSRRETYKSGKSIQAFKSHLEKLSGGDNETAKKIIEQSMANNWAGIFELKDNSTNGKTAATTQFNRKGYDPNNGIKAESIYAKKKPVIH